MPRFINMAKSGRMAAHRRQAPARNRPIARQDTAGPDRKGGPAPPERPRKPRRR